MVSVVYGLRTSNGKLFQISSSRVFTMCGDWNRLSFDKWRQSIKSAFVRQLKNRIFRCVYAVLLAQIVRNILVFFKSSAFLFAYLSGWRGDQGSEMSVLFPDFTQLPLGEICKHGKYHDRQGAESFMMLSESWARPPWAMAAVLHWNANSFQDDEQSQIMGTAINVVFSSVLEFYL